MLGLGLISRTVAEIRCDVSAAQTRDPAARDVGSLEILMVWPGVHALLAHRIAHVLHSVGVPMLPRLIATIARSITGIEIHPAATIGRGFFIDHGMGVVIGETAEIGDDVTLYHGVTLGGVAPSVNAAAQVDHKRHPTIANGAIVGAGAQVLGPITIGAHARVGANAVVVQDVPAGVAVVGIPAKAIQPQKKMGEFVAYGTPTGNVPDPVARALDSMAEKVAALQERLDALDKQPRAPAASLSKPPTSPHGAVPHVVVDNDRLAAGGGKPDC
jgi:serine O-acetyltransferase